MASPVPFSDYCIDTCLNPILDAPDINGTSFICTVEGFNQEESCVCSNCSPSDLVAMNRTSRNYCANLYPVSRSPTCSESSTGQASGTASPTSGGTGSDSDGNSEGSGDGSSSGSSGRRRGSGTAIKAGVSVGVIVAILLFLGIIYFVLGRRKFNKLQKQKAAQEAAAAAAGGGSAGAAPGVGAQPPEKQDNQEQGSTTISSPVSGHVTPNTAYQGQMNAPYYAQVPYQPQPPQQAQLYQQPQSVQGEAGPRWGQAPNTYDDGPRR